MKQDNACNFVHEHDSISIENVFFFSFTLKTMFIIKKYLIQYADKNIFKIIF